MSHSTKILCDENLPVKLIKLLSEEYDVKLAIPSSSDEEVIKLAKSDGRILITLDRHFGNISIFPPSNYCGIVLMRIHPPIIESMFSALTNLFSTISPDDFKGKLFIVNLLGFRIFPKDR